MQKQESTQDRIFEVLFLCTGNSARSILAEAILAGLAPERFRAHSAGSHPTGRVHPLALELLRERGFETRGLRSKSWDEFARPEAPALDFVFTVCDAAAGERCPIWPGQPMTAHWGVEDPAACEGGRDEQRWPFRRAFLVPPAAHRALREPAARGARSPQPPAPTRSDRRRHRHHHHHRH